MAVPVGLLGTVVLHRVRGLRGACDDRDRNASRPRSSGGSAFRRSRGRRHAVLAIRAPVEITGNLLRRRPLNRGRWSQRRADFDRFVADSTDTLLRTAYLIVWDLGEAEDLVQETLFEVARRWPRVRRMERPIAYARRILVNRALSGSARRTRTARSCTGCLPSAPPRPATSDEIDGQDELMGALAALPAAPARGARPALLPGPSRSRGRGRPEVLPRHRQEHRLSWTRATRAGDCAPANDPRSIPT